MSLAPLATPAPAADADEPGSAERPHQGGTEGFAPEMEGHGKARFSHTTSFALDTHMKDLPLDSPLVSHVSGGQEEGAHARYPTTSVAGRLVRRKKPSS